jgi:TPR repeat protein
MIVYSTNPKQGYLTKEGIDKIRSVFANDIFQDELRSIYQQQTETRNELKAESEEQMKDVLSEIVTGEINEQLVGMIMQLRSQLQTAKGKKVYGYLPKDVKQNVDSIFAMLAQDERIVKLYDKWCEFESAKYKTYTLKPRTFPPLTENKEFRSVKNMIIRTVLAMDDPIIMDEAMPEPPEPTDYSKLAGLVNNKHGLYKYGKALMTGDDVAPAADLGEELLQEAASLGNKNAERYLALEYVSSEHIEQDIDRGIKMLIELADNGDTFSAYKLGKIYLSGEIVYKDMDKAEKYLRQASDDNNEHAMYALAKLYLSDEKKDLSKAVALLEKVCDNNKLKPFAAYTYAKLLLEDNEFHDTKRAIQLLKDSADSNHWCSFLLGKLYLFGNDDTERDKAEAIKWLTKSAEAGNEYAAALIQHSEDYENAMLTNSIFGLFISLSRMIEDDYSRSQNKMQSKVDRKLRRLISQKKEELGIKSDDTMQYS